MWRCADGERCLLLLPPGAQRERPRQASPPAGAAPTPRGLVLRVRGGADEADAHSHARNEANFAELEAVPAAWRDCFLRAKPSWALRSAQARHLAAISQQADVYCTDSTVGISYCSYLVPAGADADATIAEGAPALQELRPIDLVIVPLTSMGPGIEAEANSFFLAASRRSRHRPPLSRRSFAAERCAAHLNAGRAYQSTPALHVQPPLVLLPASHQRR